MKISHCISKQTTFLNQMEFTPVCLSMQYSINKYKIYNLESNSK